MKYCLIVEDDRWFAESLAGMIEGQVKIANSATDAMQKIDENIPYMIYLDLNLGTQNGLTLLNELQSYIDTRRVPIVIVSTDAKRLDLDSFSQYGVVKIIDKTELTREDLHV